MEVNQIKGKSKGKGKNTAAKAKGKGKPAFLKGKGNGKSDKGKGKNSNGKGYGENSKGQQKGSYIGKVDANTCSYCGKIGHRQKDCYKKRRMTCRYDRLRRLIPRIQSATLELQVQPQRF